MDANRFDAISRMLASHRLSRRRALASGGTGLIAGSAMVAGVAPSTAAAQGATPVAGDDVELLFVQSFSSGMIVPAAEGDAYALTLEGGLGETIYFSDRPNRVVGAAPTSEFIAYLLESTADDPANAALIADGADGETILIVELNGASLDEATGTLTYDVVLLGEEDVDMQLETAMAEAPTGEVTLGTTHLFIDSLAGCSPWDPRC